MKKRKSEFDERESALRNQIMVHGFFVISALLFVDAFLKLFEVHWAMGRWNSFAYFMIAWTVVSIEFIVRGVYFGRKETAKYRLGGMLLWVLVFGLNIAVFLNKSLPFFENGQLSQDGIYFVIFSSMGLIGICGAIRAAYDIYKNYL